jgi:hypothetical protein
VSVSGGLAELPDPVVLLSDASTATHSAGSNTVKQRTKIEIRNKPLSQLSCRKSLEISFFICVTLISIPLGEINAIPPKGQNSVLRVMSKIP